MWAKVSGICLLVIGITFCVLKLVGYASGAFVAIGASQIAIGASLIAIGVGPLAQQRRGPKPPSSL